MSSSRQAHVQLAPLPEGRDVRLLLAGVWDLFHYGHAKAMKNAKLLFPNVTLVVGSTSYCIGPLPSYLLSLAPSLIGLTQLCKGLLNVS